MKKGLLIGGIALLLAGSAAAVFAFAQNEKTARIREILNGNGGSVSISEVNWMDMTGDGEIKLGDLMLAKLEALLHKGEPTAFFPAKDAKQLGRTAYHEDTGTLWCSLSCSGIEFDVTGKECTIELTADSAYSSGETNAVRYAVYADEKLFSDKQLLDKSELIIIPVAENGSHIRIVKLSESQNSSFGIRSVKVTGDKTENISFKAAANKSRLIEFVGDSITCGYGVDGEYGTADFKTATEDASKAYAYLTAQKLDVDYSLVSYSGYGILSGYTGNGKINRSQLVPKYYDVIGHCSARLEDDRLIQDDSWDFARQPDLVVINLGTNDASYTQSDSNLQKQFTESYVKFLKKIRKKNPDAPILCTLGTMGDTLCGAVDAAAEAYQAETGDTKIRTMWFPVQSDEDGLGVHWHPSAKTHEKAAEQLAGFIREWLNW